MPAINEPYLCGGVFLTYLLNARKQRKGARDHYKGNSDGLSDTDTFAALIRVVSSTYDTPQKETFKENTSSYKNCRKNKGMYLPLYNTNETRSFDECIKKNYSAVLLRMSTFTERYIETGTETKKDVYLVKTLIEIIAKDDTISDDAKFYSLENGTPITKKAMITSTSFCLQAFLIGVWHYILQNRPDNLRGRKTLEYWHPTIEYENNLHVWNYTLQTEEPKQTTNDTQNIEPQREATTSATDGYAFKQEENLMDDFIKEQPPAQNRMESNQMIFVQNGEHNTQIGSVGTLVINHGDKK